MKRNAQHLAYEYLMRQYSQLNMLWSSVLKYMTWYPFFFVIKHFFLCCIFLTIDSYISLSCSNRHIAAVLMASSLWLFSVRFCFILLLSHPTETVLRKSTSGYFFHFKSDDLFFVLIFLNLFAVISSTLFFPQDPFSSNLQFTLLPKGLFSFMLFFMVIGRFFSSLSIFIKYLMMCLESFHSSTFHSIAFGQSHLFFLYIIVYHLYQPRSLWVLWTIFCVIILKWLETNFFFLLKTSSQSHSS